MTFSMKKYDQERKKKSILSSIISIVSKKESSIADIQKELKMQRSTLVYYLSILEAKGDIIKTRIEDGETGRPNRIKINPNKLKKMNQTAKMRKKYMIDSLKRLQRQKEMSMDEFMSYPKFDVDSENFREIFSIPLDLEALGFVNKVYKITPEGEKFLKENSKNKK